MLLLRTEGALKFKFIQFLQKCVSRDCTDFSVLSSTAVDAGSSTSWWTPNQLESNTLLPAPHYETCMNLIKSAYYDQSCLFVLRSQIFLPRK